MKTKKRKKISPVTHVPCFVLRLKGTAHSRYGEGTCDQFVTKLKEKQAAIESAEVIYTENTLFPARKDVALIITELAENRRLPESVSDGGGTVEELRAARKQAAEIERVKAIFRSCMERLSQLQEIILNEETVLDERINKGRKNTREKIAAYIEGVRRGKLKDYTYAEPAFDDGARSIYHEKHAWLDGRMSEIVQNVMTKEDAA